LPLALQPSAQVCITFRLEDEPRQSDSRAARLMLSLLWICGIRRPHGAPSRQVAAADDAAVDAAETGSSAHTSSPAASRKGVLVRSGAGLDAQQVVFGTV